MGRTREKVVPQGAGSGQMVYNPVGSGKVYFNQWEATGKIHVGAVSSSPAALQPNSHVL